MPDPFIHIFIAWFHFLTFNSKVSSTE